MRGVRTLLTGFLLVAAFLLSFGALRHRALTAGIIHGDLGLPLLLAHVTISAHTLAGVWALTLDGLTAVGVLGVRDPGLRDWRAWAALIGGLGLSLRFQVSGYDSWEARGMAAVPPLALAMAVWIFEVGRPQPDLAEPPAQPEPAQADAPVPGSRERQPATPARPNPARPGGLTLAQQRRVEGWVAEGRTNKSWMARELGLSDRAKKERLTPLVDQLAAQQNGDRP